MHLIQGKIIYNDLYLKLHIHNYPYNLNSLLYPIKHQNKKLNNFAITLLW